MPAFTSSVDVGQRALQHCGAARMDPTLGFSDTSSRGAGEISFVYDKLRQAELRRNSWVFSIKEAMLRAIDANTMLLAPALWVAGTTYFKGSIVADQSGNLWKSEIPSNLGNDPLLTTFWVPYFGPVAVALYDSTETYAAGELVYTAPGDGTYKVYLSLSSGNADIPATATAWDATTTFFQNQVVTYSSVAYMSLFDLNINNIPLSSPTAWTTSFVGGTGSDKWLQIGGTGSPSGVALTKHDAQYPLGSGPSTQDITRNAFKLPANFMRAGYQNAKGTTTWLGGPSGNTYRDWDFENGYLITQETGPIRFRFGADVTDVTLMDVMFCEGLACRCALAIAPTLTQSNADVQEIASEYQKFMSEARTLNAIEVGYEDPPDDSYLTVRY